MRKNMAILLVFILTLSFASSALALTMAEFEAKCQGFLQDSVPPAEFAAICDEALDLSRKAPPVVREETEYSVYRYKYMALMKLENYFEAYRIADLIGNTYNDPAGACEMLISINTRRENIEAAQAAARQGIELYTAKGLKPVEFKRAYNDLEKIKAKTLKFTAEALWQAVAADPAGAKAKFASTPILLSGTAVLRQGAAGGPHSLGFDVNDNGVTKTLSCLLPDNELPFVQELQYPAQMEVHVYFDEASQGGARLNTARFIKLLP